MLIARLSNGAMILGLEEENLKRLKKGDPILKALSQYGGTDDIIIIYGKDTQAIKDQLEQVCGPLPTPMILPKGH